MHGLSDPEKHVFHIRGPSYNTKTYCMDITLGMLERVVPVFGRRMQIDQVELLAQLEKHDK